MVELLVVVAIIGILIALLLPAVQAARESARRAQCVNNLKQLGIAVHAFHDANNFLPVSNRPLGVTNAPRIGWAINALPFLEQQTTYSQYDQTKTWSDQTTGSTYPLSNFQVCGTVVSLFWCPSAIDLGVDWIPNRKTLRRGSDSRRPLTTHPRSPSIKGLSLWGWLILIHRRLRAAPGLARRA